MRLGNIVCYLWRKMREVIKKTCNDNQLLKIAISENLSVYLLVIVLLALEKTVYLGSVMKGNIDI